MIISNTSNINIMGNSCCHYLPRRPRAGGAAAGAATWRPHLHLGGTTCLTLLV